MAKFEEFYDACEGLYVIQGMTLVQIQAETEISQPTLRKWKINGEWDKKRGEYLKQNESLKSILEEIKFKLANEVLKQLKAGDFNPQSIYALSRFVASTSKKSTGDPEEPITIDPEEIKRKTVEILEEEYGIKR